MNRGMRRSSLWRNRARDPAFTAILTVQIIIIFVTPFAAMGYQVVRDIIQLLFLVFTILVYLISRGPIATTLAILAFLSDSAGYVLELVKPSELSLILGYTGSISAFVVASYALGYAVLAPGVVTFHRVLGAIALYLNIGLMFAASYRWIWYFIPNSLANVASGGAWQADSTVLYFSFVTLTSTGFGDVVPLHPLARMVANVEAIIGQLYPATLLARLITLRGQWRGP